MDTLLSIDPGKYSLAWAYWQEQDLKKTGFVSNEDWPHSMLRNLHSMDLIVVDLVVVELPRVYPNMRGRRPNDLIDVAATAGSCVTLGRDCEFVHPHEWKGQTPKSITKRRAQRVLQPEELSLVLDNHNVWDAVGIGLWRLGR